jgi:hypothetical protein
MVGPRVRAAAVVAFFAYITFVRTHDIPNTFPLLGEQTRDWTVALGSWHELPLTGTPSTGGGRGLGPAYYWVLWIGRHLVGPFTDNLPHAGGLAISLLQAAADACLFASLLRRLPFALALATALLIGTQPFEVGLSGAIWNPPVAAALAKMALALMLSVNLETRYWRLAAVAAIAWLGVQAHTSGIIVALPIFAAIVLQPLIARNWDRATDLLVVLVAVVVVLEIPFAIALARTRPTEVGPTTALESLTNVSAMNASGGFVKITSIAGWLISHGDEAWPYWLIVSLAATIVIGKFRKDVPVLTVSVVPIATATLLFASWTRPYETYWFLTLAPSVLITIGFAIVALPWPRVLQVVSLLILAVVIVQQPSRVADSRNFFRYPQYRALLAGSRKAARQAPVLSRLRAGFEVHETTDVEYMYRILGGRLDTKKPGVGTIQPDGTVTFAPTTER